MQAKIRSALAQTVIQTFPTSRVVLESTTAPRISRLDGAATVSNEEVHMEPNVLVRENAVRERKINHS